MILTSDVLVLESFLSVVYGLCLQRHENVSEETLSETFENFDGEEIDHDETIENQDEERDEEETMMMTFDSRWCPKLRWQPEWRHSPTK